MYAMHAQSKKGDLMAGPISKDITLISVDCSPKAPLSSNPVALCLQLAVAVQQDKAIKAQMAANSEKIAANSEKIAANNAKLAQLDVQKAANNAKLAQLDAQKAHIVQERARIAEEKAKIKAILAARGVNVGCGPAASAATPTSANAVKV